MDIDNKIPLTTPLTTPLDYKETASGRPLYQRRSFMQSIQGMAQKYNLPIEVATALNVRGVGIDSVSDFLSPSLKNVLPNPSVLQGMDALTDTIISCILQKKKIGIFGDYDVDGATSTAILCSYLRSIGIEYEYYIPDREKDGYGPNITALKKLSDSGCAIILCVDCGTTAFETLELAHAASIDVAIIDHHTSEAQHPKNVGFVNPNRLDDTSGLEYLCAAGVVFCTLVSINRALRENGFFNTGIKEPNLLNVLDLVALGTVCDVMPLTGLNRAFVAQGLKVMAKRTNKGLSCLCDVAGVDSVPSAYHLGFILGPRLNAAGRVGESFLATQLLLEHDAAKAFVIAEELHSLNQHRQDVEKIALEEAIRQVKMENADKGHFICVVGNDWHAGIVGIVAGRIKEQFNKPAVAITLADGVGKGSGRSVSGIDLGGCVMSAKYEGLLETGGGHKMAAGLSVKPENIEKFTDYMQTRICESLKGENIVVPSVIDVMCSVQTLTPALYENLQMLEPYGVGNPEPRFIVKDVFVASTKILKEKHIKFSIKSPKGGKNLQGICFNCVGTKMGDWLLDSANSSMFSMVGKIRLNNWNGTESVQLLLEDMAI